MSFPFSLILPKLFFGSWKDRDSLLRSWNGTAPLMLSADSGVKVLPAGADFAGGIAPCCEWASRGGTAALTGGFVEVATPDRGGGVRDGVGGGGARSGCASLAAGAIVSVEAEQRSLGSDRGQDAVWRRWKACRRTGDTAQRSIR